MPKNVDLFIAEGNVLIINAKGSNINKTKIKVLLYIDSLMIGGMHRQILYLARFLDRNKYEPIVCTQNSRSGGLRNEYERSGCRLIDLNRNSVPGNKKVFDPFVSIKLLQVLNAERPHIVMVNAAPNLVYLRIALLFYPHAIKQVGSFRALSFWKGHLNALYSKLDGYFARWLYLSSDRTVVNSHALKAHY